MNWVASNLTLPRNVVYPELLTLMCAPRLPAVDWTDAPADLNGLVRFGERRNLVSASVPSRFKRTIKLTQPFYIIMFLWSGTFSVTLPTFLYVPIFGQQSLFLHLTTRPTGWPIFEPDTSWN